MADFVLGTVSPPPLAKVPPPSFLSLAAWLSKYYNRKLGRGLGMSLPSSYFFDVSCELTMMMRRGGGEESTAGRRDLTSHIHLAVLFSCASLIPRLPC